jgi:hypothetical protein
MCRHLLILRHATGEDIVPTGTGIGKCLSYLLYHDWPESSLFFAKQPARSFFWFMTIPPNLKPSHRRQLWVITAVTAAILLVLALALSLGLGLGLRHRHRNGSQTSPTSALLGLTPQTSENFVVGSIVGQSPQDRRYNFTVALANGAPDGVNKTMLVVNGAFLLRLCAVIMLSALHRPPTFTRILGGRCGDSGKPLVTFVSLK